MDGVYIFGLQFIVYFFWRKQGILRVQFGKTNSSSLVGPKLAVTLLKSFNIVACPMLDSNTKVWLN